MIVFDFHFKVHGKVFYLKNNEHKKYFIEFSKKFKEALNRKAYF